jgi:o-succinylbenzoate---CoA ligase
LNNFFAIILTSGSTGEPKMLEVEKVRMWDSALTTIQTLGLQEGNTALLCMPLRYIAGQMMLVRSFAGQLQLIAVAPTSHPYASLHEAPDLAALTPMQVFESLKVPHERSLLRRTLCIIIGGGVISPALEEELATFPHPVYSTYGMTET